MRDVFISYARVDRDYAIQLCEALRGRNVSVWWDWDLVGGEDFRGRIRSMLDAAPRVVVLWSKDSVKSAFVIDEASEAKKQGKLVPLSIDGSSPPFGFGDLHTIPANNIEGCLDQVVAALQGEQVQAKVSPPPPRRRGLVGRGAIAAAGAILVFAAVGAWAYRGGYLFGDGGSGTAETGERKQRALRLALVVGNQNYRNIAKLWNPLRDTDAVSAALKERGFTVVKKGDMDADGLAQAIKNFETTLSSTGGIGLFYYAGNAVHLDGEDILVPVDAEYDMNARVVKGGISLTALQQEIKAESSQAEKDDGMYVIYSASKGQTSSDGIPGQHSPFATAFLEALQTSADDIVGTYDLIFKKMSEPVAVPAEVVKEAGSNIVRLGKGAARKTTTTRPQTPYFEKRSATKFVFNDDTFDQDIGVLRILIVDSARDDPMGTKVALR
jgi:hypothetical protein